MNLLKDDFFVNLHGDLCIKIPKEMKSKTVDKLIEDILKGIDSPDRQKSYAEDKLVLIDNVLNHVPDPNNDKLQRIQEIIDMENVKFD